jgi:hypothetical protein
VSGLICLRGCLLLAWYDWVGEHGYGDRGTGDAGEAAALQADGKQTQSEGRSQLEKRGQESHAHG